MINFKPLLSNYEFFQIVKPLGKSIHLRAGETVKADVIDILPTGGIVLRMKGGILTVETEIPLQKDMSLLLKILNTPSTDHRLKIQILGVLDKNGFQLLNLQEEKIKDIISFISSSPQIKNKIIDMAFSLITQGNLSNSEKSVLSMLLINALKNEKINNLLASSGILLSHINRLSPEKFRELIVNSGIFFENKLKNKKIKELDRDIKATLLSKKELSHEEKNILKGIETYQILSKLTGGIFSYLPVFWEDIDRGDIFFKKSKRGKNMYFCRIDLDFKNLGKFFSGVFLFGKDLYLNFYIENEILMEKVKEDTDILKDELLKDNFNSVFIKFLKEIPQEKKFIDEDFLRLKV
ncbi:hypothetical protein SAMN06265182_1618 [Persephonella hydrogeniphila]|uniref:Flagellar hook-length control protein FliK n=1 Tax=Persephonella hydrogeniphila TaxID=198703 RepID=A0A285NLB4_9AQUI|nr:hypothetical protein [Persephonella hydrogeniphila]SNZ09713.1 hypothetical protein SAMN06265182_1618 [Persephonella hydrogeniphila]